VRRADVPLLDDGDPLDHERWHVLDDQFAQGLVAFLAAEDVEAERLPLQADAGAERDVEIEDNTALDPVQRQLVGSSSRV